MKHCSFCREPLERRYRHHLCVECREDEDAECAACRQPLQEPDLITGQSLCTGCYADLLSATGRRSAVKRASRLREDFEPPRGKTPHALEESRRRNLQQPKGKAGNANFAYGTDITTPIT